MNRRPQRFYEKAEAAAAGDEGFVVHLDGRPVRTPQRGLLSLPTRAAAEAVAAEWAAQDEQIRPRTMPLTGLATTAIDRMGEQRRAVIDNLLGYADTDLPCYRASGPPELVALQAARWQPMLDWAALTFDAPLAITSGVLPIAQPPAAVEALRRPLEVLPDLVLTAAAAVIQALGSIVLGLAVIYRRLDVEAAFALAFLDEIFQAGHWGEDADATAQRRRISEDIEAAVRLIALIGWRPPNGAGLNQR